MPFGEIFKVQTEQLMNVKKEPIHAVHVDLRNFRDYIFAFHGEYAIGVTRTFAKRYI